jgi:hypothetical protein
MADASTARTGAIRPARPSRSGGPVQHVLAIVLGLFSTLLGLLFLAWLVLFVTKGRFLKHTFERYASNYTKRQVRVDGDFNFYFDPIAVRFLAERMSISNPSWASKPNLFQARLLDTRVETIPLIFGKYHIAWITMLDGFIDAEWNRAHKANTWTLDPNAPPIQMPQFLIKRANVAGTVIRYRDPSMKVAADVEFQAVNAANNQIQNAIRFSGSGSARGVPFTLNGAQTTPNQVLNGGENQFELHASAADAHLDVSGTLPGATQIEGADLAVAVRGGNLRRLFDVAGIAIPDTRAYSLRSHLTKQGSEYRFTRIAGRYGNSDLGGSMTVDTVPPGTDGKMKLTADLSSRLVDFVDIGPFVGYDPNKIATQGVKAAATTQPQHKGGAVPRILPDAPLRVDALKMFNAEVSYRVQDIRQKFIPISNILLKLSLEDSLLRLAPLNFDMAGGHVASTIGINARGPQVVTDYDIRVSPTPMAKLFARFGVSDAGTTGTIKARVQMKGTGNSIRSSLASSNGRIAIVLPRGTFWTQYIQLSEFDVGTFVQRLFQHKLKEPVQLNCGLIAFTIRNGVAAADPVLIDTSKNVMTARGGFSFQDESLALAFRADAKKISLFSAQSPVGIGGHFAAPAVQIVTPKLLARGGAAVAAGILFPPAAALAFVDPGDAKSTACGPVLAAAHASQQRDVKGRPRKDIGTGTTTDVNAQKKHKKFLGIF